MQTNSIKRLTIDWTEFRNTVIAQAGAAQTIVELNPAIRQAIALLGASIAEAISVAKEI